MSDRFRFRLNRLLSLRERAQDRAAVALAQALDTAARLEAERSDAAAVATTARLHQTSPTGGASRDGERAALQWLGECADWRVAALTTQQAEAAEDTERRRRELLVRTRERRVLEKLRDRQAERWRDEHARRTQHQMDDVALRITSDRPQDDLP